MHVKGEHGAGHSTLLHDWALYNKVYLIIFHVKENILTQQMLIRTQPSLTSLLFSRIQCLQPRSQSDSTELTKFMNIASQVCLHYGKILLFTVAAAIEQIVP